MPERMHVSAPASAANLGPGFDCLAVALELRNEVTIGPGEGDGVEVTVEGEGVRAASRGADNLFVRAFRAAGADARGLRFEMRNRIPFYRGLGSSAATIAAGVAAGLAWTGRDADPLPAGGRARGPSRQRRGGAPRRAHARLDSGARARRDPPGGLPRRLRRGRARRRASDQAGPRGAARDDRACRRRPYDRAGRASGRRPPVRPHRGPADALDDRLHEPYREPFVPLLAAVRGRLDGLPVYGATISGAGPSVLVWCERGAAEAVAEALAGVAPRVLPLGVAGSGVEIG